MGNDLGMSNNSNVRLGDHEKYLELCALAPTGELSTEERTRLNEHAATCGECRDLLASSQAVALQRMASLGAVRNSTDELDPSAFGWNLDGARERFLATVRSRGVLQAPTIISKPIAESTLPSFRTSSQFNWRVARVYLGAAAVLLLSVSVAYQFGYRRGKARDAEPSAVVNHESPLREEVAKLQAEHSALDGQLATERQTIDTLAAQAKQQEIQITELKDLKASLSAQNRQQAEALASNSAEREQLLRRLDDSEKSLKAVRDDLSLQRAQHDKTLLRTVSLETEIDQLSAQMREKDDTIGRQDQFLAADRDVRELMGARQLFIADVFDVDGVGQTRKPFGRVFYTKAKSLMFYAFDLDQMPSYRQAKAFQAWGREGQDGAKPVSLGIFYMDNEANRRWVLKSDDPKALAQIDAVFVTVEPKGGSTKPSGKPFLYAYLHKAPLNHP
jgi:Anti-sigma-K factor rskA